VIEEPFDLAATPGSVTKESKHVERFAPDTSTLHSNAKELASDLSVFGLQRKTSRHRDVIEEPFDLAATSGSVTKNSEHVESSDTSTWHLNAKELAPDLSVFGLQRKAVRHKDVIEEPRDLAATTSSDTKTSKHVDSPAPDTSMFGLQRETVTRRSVVEEPLDPVEIPRGIETSTWHLNAKGLAPDLSVFGLQRKTVRHRNVVEEPIDPVATPSSVTEKSSPVDGPAPDTSVFGLQRESIRRRSVVEEPLDPVEAPIGVTKTPQYVHPNQGDVNVNTASLLGLQRTSSRCKAQLVNAE